MKDLRQQRNDLVKYVTIALLTAGNLGYVVVASLVALWIVNPGLSALALAVGFILVLVGLASAPRGRGRK